MLTLLGAGKHMRLFGSVKVTHKALLGVLVGSDLSPDCQKLLYMNSHVVHPLSYTSCCSRLLLL